MIFDTESMSKLRAKYANEPRYRIPRIILLDRSDELSGEREYLEELVQSVPKQVQRGWVARLVNTDPAQHLGAWFEMMLYGWLRQLGPVAAEPCVGGSQPDFVLSIAGQEIVVEARACLVGKAEREQDKLKTEVLSLLNSIPLPYIVSVDQLVLNKQADTVDIMDKVDAWLRTSPRLPFHYQDGLGNEMRLTAQEHATLETVGFRGSKRPTWPSPEPLKAPLREKAGQHKELRKAGYPYVLAFLLESRMYTAGQVAEAWFGGTKVIVDIEDKQIVSVGPDRTGLLFFGRQVRHRTVSGILVFRADLSTALGRHELKPWYIQNPVARTPVAPSLFPAVSRYISVDEEAGRFTMAWKSDSPKEDPLTRRAN